MPLIRALVRVVDEGVVIAAAVVVQEQDLEERSSADEVEKEREEDLIASWKWHVEETRKHMEKNEAILLVFSA